MVSFREFLGELPTKGGRKPSPAIHYVIACARSGLSMIYIYIYMRDSRFAIPKKQ